MLRAKLYFNGDDCFLVWTMPRTVDCWGFALQRDLVTASGKHFNNVLANRTGFDGDNNPPHSLKPSTEWPFQRYTWTDHGVNEGDTVSYTITPVMKTAAGLMPDDAAKVTVGPVAVAAAGDGKASAYFNRGILMSQFVAKKLGDNFTLADLKKLKANLDDHTDELRQFLMGPLGARLEDLLALAQKNKWHLYAALYELDDDDLVDALIALGKRAHVVLSNGSEKAKGKDGNAKAAKKLGDAIDLSRRMLWSEGLGHNKFAVFAETANAPAMVWTGSTNWSTTGLCTQMNNSVLIRDAKLAQVYLDQWKLLKDDKRTGRGGAAMHFGDALMESNNQAKTGSAGKTGKWTTWFTRTAGGPEMDEVTELINGAKKAILFLMFEPGTSGLLQVIQARLSPASSTYDKDLYVHGVVNTLKPDTQTESVEVVHAGANTPFELDIVQPEGVQKDFAGWAKEVTRREFLVQPAHGVIGFAINHSKVIVIDPFTDPVVVTGSHNFSKSASGKNDENLIIIKGNSGLAQRYAVNIMGVYQHYRWRAYLVECAAKGVSPWQGLRKDDKWQKADAEKDAELEFWLQEA